MRLYQKLFAVFGVCLLHSVSNAQLTVTATIPSINLGNVAPNATISIDFDRPLDLASFSGSAFTVWGHTTGKIEGQLFFAQSNMQAVFTPLAPYFPGERVVVSLSDKLKAQDGSFLRPEGYVLSFFVRSAPAPMSFSTASAWDVSPGIFSRIYGGQTCDLDGDGFSDLAIVNENTSDVRVFLNNHDGTGSYGGLLGAPHPVGNTPSPNENADLNGDGHIDIVTCESGSSTVSVLLGLGNGSFQPSVSYSVGNPSSGLALFEADGDGDVDIAATAGDMVMILLNDGNGVMGPAYGVSTAVQSDYGLSAADMNNDGITDLVVGGTAGGIMVLQSIGNGTFNAMPVQASVGFAWMLVCGDVNGDGNMDVTAACGGHGNGAVLLGHGDGTLGAPNLTPPVGHMVATDLGDLDGDGDMDWVLSSFGAGLYQIWKNDGAGLFTLDQTLPGVQNPACCAILDIDGDRDLDLALLDETSDIVTLERNGVLDQQTYCYGTVAACPCGNAGAAGHGCENSFGTGGGLLVGQGTASVSNDQFALNAGGLTPLESMVFLQSAGQVVSGSPFGDGLLCLAAPITRLKVKSALNGFASLGAGNAGDPPLSVLGSITLPGTTVFYQAWYRNPDAYCTSATFNVSNGLKVTWTP